MSESFPTTAWSMLADVAEGSSEEREAAVNRFVARYWRPVYYFVRTRGWTHHAAEDLTQGFFVKMLEKNWLEAVDAGRGRFRSILLTILTRFLADESPARMRRQEAFEDRLVCVSTLMGDAERQFEPPSDARPEDVFMRQWAQALVDDVREAVRRWCDEQARPDWYRIFTARHFPDDGTKGASQRELAERFGCSRDQIRYAIEQTNTRFTRLFREAVARQVGRKEEIDAEIREIERLLSQ